MTGRFVTRSAFGWAIVAGLVGILISYNVFLLIRYHSLRAKYEENEKLRERLKDERIEGEYARGSAPIVYGHWRLRDNVMTEMLRHCESRDEFVVREGPRIAWSELSGSTDRSKRFGIYVPTGKHRLRYAVGFGEQCGGVGYQRFRHGDPREIQDAVTVELGPESEVYEIRLNVSDEQPPEIEVLGRDNARIHEEALPPEARGQISKTALNEGFFFPSEFKPDEKERPYFMEPALPPVTDLGFLSGAAEIRLWIESDARPCMPAIYVAANYLKVTSLRYRHDNPPPVERVTDPDTEFNRLFEPYDGSLRFYFREGIFRERVLAVSNGGSE